MSSKLEDAVDGSRWLKEGHLESQGPKWVVEPQRRGGGFKVARLLENINFDNTITPPQILSSTQVYHMHLGQYNGVRLSCFRVSIHASSSIFHLSMYRRPKFPRCYLSRDSAPRGIKPFILPSLPMSN